MTITCIISFVVGAMLTMCAIGLMSYQKDKKQQNNVHFYAARDKCGMLWLYLSKPVRGKKSFECNTHGCVTAYDSLFENLGLNKNDYKDLKWEDEPVEVFLNLED